MKKRSWRRGFTVVLILVALYFVRSNWFTGSEEHSTGLSSGTATRLEEAFQKQQSGLVVEGAGTVERILSDDLEGSRHQRFILRLPTGRTLLVSHNIDLAPRVAALQKGDRVEFRGQYEWNERGGLVHWTHHDPQNRRPGGWLRHGGDLYR